MKVLMLTAVFLVGCTTHWPAENSVSDQTTLPATIVCLFSACDTVLADRNADAEAGAAIVDQEDISAKQEASADIKIPLAP